MSFTDQYRIEKAADNCEILRARLAKYEDDQGNPKSQQPSGVVLPERISIAGHLTADSSYRASGWNACLDEVARLNSSPSSAHDSDCSTNNLGVPELLGPCDCSLSARAGVVDERAAFECDYARYAQMTVAEVQSLWDGDLYQDQGLRDAWHGWQARAALTASAPNHSKQVREEWVLVEDRFPITWDDPDGDLQVVATNGEVTRAVTFYKKRGYCGWRKLCGLSGITMWRHLPAAPSVGSQQGGDV